MSSEQAFESVHHALRQAVARFQELLKLSEQAGSAEDTHGEVMRLLDDHLQNVKSILHSHSRRVEAVLKEHQLTDHAEPEAIRRDLERLWPVWQLLPTGGTALCLSRLLDELQEELDEEERDLLPVLKQEEAEAVVSEGRFDGNP